jgi:hypothetical protein
MACMRSALPVSHGRRKLLLGAAAAAMFAPLSLRAAGVCTPHELTQRFTRAVAGRLVVPSNEALIYAMLAEAELSGHPEAADEPQYVLVVDSSPVVQSAMLFWRLAPGRLDLVGATPASTGTPLRPGCLQTPCGVFAQADAPDAGRVLAARVYDFGVQRVRRTGGQGMAALHLQAHAAHGASRARLGTAQSDGRVLLPASLVAFLDAYGVLDAQRRDLRTPDGQALPFAGQYLVVVDSERDRRPDWALA